MPGSVREIAFEDYVVEGVSFSGHKRIENVTEGEQPTFEIRVNLELSSTTKKGETRIVHRRAEKTQVWLEGFNDRMVKNKYSVSGEANIEGVVGEKEKTIRQEMQELVMVQGCKFPQSGETFFSVNTIDNKDYKFTLNYGTGDDEDCDGIVTMTMGESSQELDLAERWWKEVRKNNE